MNFSNYFIYFIYVHINKQTDFVYKYLINELIYLYTN